MAHDHDDVGRGLLINISWAEFSGLDGCRQTSKHREENQNSRKLPHDNLLLVLPPALACIQRRARPNNKGPYLSLPTASLFHRPRLNGLTERVRDAFRQML